MPPKEGGNPSGCWCHFPTFHSLLLSQLRVLLPARVVLEIWHGVVAHEGGKGKQGQGCMSPVQSFSRPTRLHLIGCHFAPMRRRISPVITCINAPVLGPGRLVLCLALLLWGDVAITAMRIGCVGTPNWVCFVEGQRCSIDCSGWRFKCSGSRTDSASITDMFGSADCNGMFSE